MLLNELRNKQRILQLLVLVLVRYYAGNVVVKQSTTKLFVAPAAAGCPSGWRDTSHQGTNESVLHFPLHTALETYFKILCEAVCERHVGYKVGNTISS
jgi:hypothetical protein